MNPVATFYPAATPATTYLRCELPARYLPAQIRQSFEVAFTDDTVLFPEHIGRAAILQLAGDKMAALVSHHLQLQGIRVLVETDDNYRTIAPKPIRERSGWGLSIGEAEHTLKGHAYICRHADGVIVSTPFLADQYRHVNPNVYVCPNTVDPQDWPEREERDDGILRIAWVASRSHTDDAPLVAGALEWASRQPGVEVWTVGINPPWRFARNHIEWIDSLADYRGVFRLFDIGVAPVMPTPFGLGRSDVKFLEYTMGGCASVVSDNAPYSSLPDGVCIKAAGKSAFRQAIKHLVRNRDEVKQLAAAARDYVLQERTTQAQVHHWQNALNP